ncbi:MAG: T9SS type A sorting domain-containing protein [Bacteroidia bacterium]|nr:T9SS type A sorting domain-containing protein [Bacteroidia bacterium]
MKTMKLMFTILSLSVMYQFAAAQSSCSGNKFRMVKGSYHCGCHCQKKCVAAADTAAYRANFWYFGTGCFGSCCWVRLDSDEGVSPTETSFTSIYPNPTSGSATVSFYISQTQKVSFKLFDMTGRLVATLEDEIFEEGENEFYWNTSGTSAGVYFLRMETESYSETKKLSLIN